MNWDGFGPLILPYAPTLSAPLMKQAVRKAAIEFLAYTKAWQAELTPIVGNGVLTDFAFPVPADAAVEKLLAVDVKDLYGNNTQATVCTSLRGNRLIRQNARDLLAFTKDATTLTVRPAQPATSQIVATVALKPTMAASTLPDEVFEQYGTDIANGALQSLLAMANKPWADLTTARIAAAEFINAKAVTARKVERGLASNARTCAIRWY